MNKIGYFKNTCRLCKSSNLAKFLDLGLQPPSDQFIKFEKTRDHKTFYPLEVNNCMACGFKQLSYVVNKKILYQTNLISIRSILTKVHPFFRQYLARFSIYTI